MPVSAAQRDSLDLQSLTKPVSASAHRLIKRLAANKADAEAVHQLRICVRVLGVAVQWAGGTRSDRAKAILETLRRIRGRAGRVRDCDVAAELIAKMTSTVGLRERASAAIVIEHLRHAKARARRRLVKFASRRQARHLHDDLTILVRGMMISPSSAGRKLSQAVRAVVRLVARGGERVEDLHRVRIALKRVRYSGQLGETVIGRGGRTIVRQAKRAAAAVGRALDVRVALDALDRAVRENPTCDPSLERLQRRLEDRWKRLRPKAENEVQVFVRAANASVVVSARASR